MTLRADEHYRVIRENGDIRMLGCNFCEFWLARIDYRRGGDRYGLSSYNRVRAAMVKHIYAAHPQAIQAKGAQ